MKKSFFIILLIVVISSPGGLWAATYSAASCSQAHVSAAVASASDGDTVNIPACAATSWTSGLTITKAITLQGAGVGRTILVDSVTSGPMLTIETSGTSKSWRVTGLEIRGGSHSRSWSHVMGIGGNSYSFRVDNCKFYNWLGSGGEGTRAIWVQGDLLGVIDSNTFDRNGQWTQAIAISHPNWGGVGSYGDNAWADSDNFGTSKFVFIEDNTFTSPAGTTFPGIMDVYSGGRVVLRYNTVRNDFAGTHGTESSGRNRGVRAFEVYQNTFTFDGSPAWFTTFYVRSGTGVIYNNTISGSSAWINAAANIANYRSSGSYAPWGQCNGSSAFDGNNGTPSGYPCIDQPGRGKGNLLSGNTPTPAAWPGQLLSPIYVWGNTGFRNSQAVSDSSHVVLNRDFYVGSEKPGYTAYTYPHPLRSGTIPSAAPSAPTGLKIVQ
jgi:hypothetical protein